MTPIATKSAPPIAPLANKYHQRFQTKEKGVAFLMTYLRKPDKQKSIDQQAVARFGLTPPFHSLMLNSGPSPIGSGTRAILHTEQAVAEVKKNEPVTLCHTSAATHPCCHHHPDQERKNKVLNR